MELTVVGCSGSFPGPESPSSCYLIEHGETRILLDLGNGALGQLQRYVDIYDIDAIFISHLHIDHCADVGSYYVARRYCGGGNAPAIPIYGPSDTEKRLVEIYGPTDAPGLPGQFNFFDLGSDVISVGSITVQAFPVDHVLEESYALRVEADGRVLAYSGDTDTCDGLLQASQNAHVGLFEASFVETKPYERHIHMTGKHAAEMANKAQVSRLILTHLAPWTDPEQVLVDAHSEREQVDLAHPGMKVEI